MNKRNSKRNRYSKLPAYNSFSTNRHYSCELRDAKITVWGG